MFMAKKIYEKKNVMKNFELISHIPTSKQHSDLTHYSENPLFEQDKKV